MTTNKNNKSCRGFNIQAVICLGPTQNELNNFPKKLSDVLIRYTFKSSHFVDYTIFILSCEETFAS